MEPHRLSLVAELRQKISRMEVFRQPRGQPSVSTGVAPLDGLLPHGGLAPGTLVEWFDACDGAAAGWLALATAREACAEGGALVVFDRRDEFYPVEAVRRGVDPARLIVVRADTWADTVWALREALGQSAVGAVLAWPGRIPGRDFRRMQLAVERGGGLGLLVRPEAARGDPSWAETRLAVEPLPSGTENRRRLRIRLLRARGVSGESSVDVEIDETSCRVYPVAPLAHPAIAGVSGRASSARGGVA